MNLRIFVRHSAAHFDAVSGVKFWIFHISGFDLPEVVSHGHQTTIRTFAGDLDADGDLDAVAELHHGARLDVKDAKGRDVIAWAQPRRAAPHHLAERAQRPAALLAVILQPRQVALHALLDGRDTPPSSAVNYVAAVQRKIDEIGCGEIATLCGRYYAMDRDKRWERINLAYDAIVRGLGPTAATAGRSGWHPSRRSAPWGPKNASAFANVTPSGGVIVH